MVAKDRNGENAATKQECIETVKLADSEKQKGRKGEREKKKGRKNREGVWGVEGERKECIKQMKGKRQRQETTSCKEQTHEEPMLKRNIFVILTRPLCGHLLNIINHHKRLDSFMPLYNRMTAPVPAVS